MFGAETHGTAAPHPQAKLHQRSSLERCSALIFCMNDSSVYVSRSGLVVTKPNKVCFALRTAEALKSVSEEREEKKKKEGERSERNVLQIVSSVASGERALIFTSIENRCLEIRPL